MSRTKTFVLTPPPASRQMRAAALSTGKLVVPTVQQKNTPTDGGQGRRKDGHVGKRELRVGVGDGGDAGGAHGKAGARNANCDLSEHRQMVLTPKALLGTSRRLRQDLTKWASTLS